MDDTDHCFEDFPYFQGVDLTLWFQLLLAALLVLAGGLVWGLAA
jgi:hypothetical protein